MNIQDVLHVMWATVGWFLVIIGSVYLAGWFPSGQSFIDVVVNILTQPKGWLVVLFCALAGVAWCRWLKG